MVYNDMLRLDADVLLRETRELTDQERLLTARLLVRLAAVEKRQLYAPCGYTSMWDYCLGELRMSEESAGRRLWGARKCREFPALFDALADGRIHLTAIHTLAPHLRADNVDELITAATGRSKTQLLDWLACRFPRLAAPTVIKTVTPGEPMASAPQIEVPHASAPDCKENLHSLASVNVHMAAAELAASASPEVAAPGAPDMAVPAAPELAAPAAPELTVPAAPVRDRAQLVPLNPEQVKVQFTMSRKALDKMKRAMDLLGPKIAPNDVAALFEKLLDMAIPVLEKKKFAATGRPRAPRTRTTANARSIPSHVKREVWNRDGGRCTFTSATGRRCECTRGLEFDHVKPVALGGEATLENLRLLCRTHNRLEAERRLGPECMKNRRAASSHRGAA